MMTQHKKNKIIYIIQEEVAKYVKWLKLFYEVMEQKVKKGICKRVELVSEEEWINS